MKLRKKILVGQAFRPDCSQGLLFCSAVSFAQAPRGHSPTCRKSPRRSDPRDGLRMESEIDCLPEGFQRKERRPVRIHRGAQRRRQHDGRRLDRGR